MAMTPPGPPSHFKIEDPEEDSDSHYVGDKDVEYVSKDDATDSDKVDLGDRLALLAGLGLAQLLRLVIIFAAIGLIFLFFFITQHL